MSSAARPALPIVAVLAFDQISAFHLAVPCAVFGEAQAGVPAFDVRVCAAEPGRLRSTAGFALQPDFGLAVLRRADIVIVPSWRDPGEAVPAALLKALQAAHRRGAQIVGLCLGAYVLAEAGLLAGCRATTHWAYAQDFARRFPQIAVEVDVLYIEEGQVLTSAGTAAGIDACLHLLRRRCGSQLANSVARRLVVPPHRQGGQAQYIEQAVPLRARESKLSALLDEVRAKLDQPHSLDSLAARALMSRRSFTRHFQQLTGSTVGEWLLRERLSYCQRLLEGGDQSVEVVAAQAGFGSAASLRLHFHKAFAVSPSAWRRSFRAA
ncbi:transcriptional regulator GlxA family with amidase domain [Paucibacter oligotrophus]|uniref:Transcriptional regulator GlxA family with amidase domain n=1 Tax=Roseateles oligotrophus TaxID=1769250 RepID=A0A840LAN4_9BURK|nr:helix-turn-helix domain-containing protein [Roseateles oligotrophus]MBB4845206.1 transcriptional regulator GlxA family with amidase domain [Roseateles oligotrophus]